MWIHVNQPIKFNRIELLKAESITLNKLKPDFILQLFRI